MLTLKELYEVVGKPTTINGKMGKDTLCFNTDPEQCVIGSQLRKNPKSVCFSCYSLRLCNFRTNVHESYRRNHKLLLDALMSKGHEVVADMVSRIIEKKDRLKVRVKDGGDVVDESEFDMWWSVAKRNLKRRYWLPTKEYAKLRNFLRRVGKLPKNLVIRVSSPMVNQSPMKEFEHTSVVYTKDKYDAVRESASVKKCRAKEQDNKCLSCTFCYDTRVKTVIYEGNKLKKGE